MPSSTWLEHYDHQRSFLSTARRPTDVARPLLEDALICKVAGCCAVSSVERTRSFRRDFTNGIAFARHGGVEHIRLPLFQVRWRLHDKRRPSELDLARVLPGPPRGWS